MRHHLNFIRYAMATTGEGFWIPLGLVFLILVVLPWIGAIMIGGK